MRLALAHFLAAAMIAAAILAASGAFRRSWARVILGAGLCGLALLFGYWIILY